MADTTNAAVTVENSKPTKAVVEPGDDQKALTTNVYLNANVCAKCSKPATMKCSKCKVVLTHYCSRECQRDDWKGHKKVCGKAPKTEPEPQFISFEDYMAEEGNQNMFADPITAMLNDGVIDGDGDGFVSEMNKAVEVRRSVHVTAMSNTDISMRDVAAANFSAVSNVVNTPPLCDSLHSS